MASVEIDVGYVAHLARLAIPEDEKARLQEQLSHVLSYIEKLRELDVGDVEPMAHAIPLANIARADVPQPSLPAELALQNAPAQANGLFIVPKIVE